MRIRNDILEGVLVRTIRLHCSRCRIDCNASCAFYPYQGQVKFNKPKIHGDIRTHCLKCQAVDVLTDCETPDCVLRQQVFRTGN